LILLLSREVLLICVNLYPGEKWQGIGSRKLTRTAGKPSPQNALGHYPAGAVC
jgi:hypothetical protein